jgi:hypothetical protein
MEVCRVGITLTDKGTVDVAAPMARKDICYEMLRAARAVIERTPAQHFLMTQRSFTITMGHTGVVDVSAPLPHRELAELLLDRARDVVERYNDEAAPEMRGFAIASGT